MKKVKRLFHRVSSYYINGIIQLYRPALDAGVNPFM